LTSTILIRLSRPLSTPSQLNPNLPTTFPNTQRRKKPARPTPLIQTRPKPTSFNSEASAVDTHIKDLNNKYNTLLQHIQRHDDVPLEGSSPQSDLPFTPDILAFPFPEKFKIPTFEAYDGTGDPTDHVEKFRTLMALRGAADPIMCRVFPITLAGSARLWFIKLKPNSVGSFADLRRQFHAQFLWARRKKRLATYLLTIKQDD
jgi:hypothetical protein